MSFKLTTRAGLGKAAIGLAAAGAAFGFAAPASAQLGADAAVCRGITVTVH